MLTLSDRKVKALQDLLKIHKNRILQIKTEYPDDHTLYSQNYQRWLEYDSIQTIVDVLEYMFGDSEINS